MLSWLKKYGQLLLNIFLQVEGFGQVAEKLTTGTVQADITKGVDTLTNVATVVQGVEAAFTAAFGTANKTGAAKFQAAMPGTLQAIQAWLTANFPGTAEVGDQTLYTKGCQEVLQGVADILNSLKPNVKTTQALQVSGPAAPVVPPNPMPNPQPQVTP